MKQFKDKIMSHLENLKETFEVNLERERVQDFLKQVNLTVKSYFDLTPP